MRFLEQRTVGKVPPNALGLASLGRLRDVEERAKSLSRRRWRVVATVDMVAREVHLFSARVATPFFFVM